MDSQIKVSAFQDDSLGNYDAYDISENKKGELSTSIVTGDAIKRAKSTNPKLNAITVENFDIAQTNSKTLFRIFSRRSNFY